MRSPPGTCSIPTSHVASRSSSPPSRFPTVSTVLRPPRSSTCSGEARPRADGRLLYGVALQRLGRQLSAARQFDAAAKEAPENVEAQVAAAVGRFDKMRPAEAFSRLGPLTRRFPGRATVRFHLGLLLLWAGEVKEAKTQLARATTAEPGTPLAREAERYLAELRKAGV